MTASEVIGAQVLPPIVAQLQTGDPGLRVELMLTNRVQNLLRREADITARMARPDQGQLIARSIGTLALGLYAHRRYPDRYGTPQTSAELASHRLIGYDEETPFLRSARKAFLVWRRESFAVRCDSDLAQLAMVRSEGGIGVCQVRLAQRDPHLVRVLPELVAGSLETWLVMHEDLRASPRCRVTFDALLHGLGAHFTAQGLRHCAALCQRRAVPGRPEAEPQPAVTSTVSTSQGSTATCARATHSRFSPAGATQSRAACAAAMPTPRAITHNAKWAALSLDGPAGRLARAGAP